MSEGFRNLVPRQESINVLDFENLMVADNQLMPLVVATNRAMKWNLEGNSGKEKAIRFSPEDGFISALRALKKHLDEKGSVYNLTDKAIAVLLTNLYHDDEPGYVEAISNYYGSSQSSQ